MRDPLMGTWRDTDYSDKSRNDFYTSIGGVHETKPLVSSRSMGKVYFTHNFRTSRLSKLMRLPRFSRSLHPHDSKYFPTRTRALKAELQKACDYFATMLSVMGLRPSDTKRFGLLFTLFNTFLLGIVWPLFQLFACHANAQDPKVEQLSNMSKYYRYIIYVVALFWMVRISKRWNVEALLFLKVENLYVSRIAEEKGLGGMWVYATIIQNFALEVLCLFGPYFFVMAFGKAWWIFNTSDKSRLYSVTYSIGNLTLLDCKSPFYKKMLFYLAEVISQSYMQVVFLIPCVYFRMVSSLVLLEMKAYKAMVQPEKDEVEKEGFGDLLKEEVSIESRGGHAQDTHNANRPSLNASSWANESEMSEKTREEERERETEEGPPNSLKSNNSMGEFIHDETEQITSLPTRMYQGPDGITRPHRRNSVFNRYGSNPFGMYVDSKRLDENEYDDLDKDLTDSEEEEGFNTTTVTAESFPVLREHSLLQRVLKLISHRFRQFLLTTFILIFFESFGTLYFLLNAIMEMDDKEAEHYNILGILVRLELSTSALLHVMGFVLNIRAILIMTHRLRAVHTIASEQHAHLTCKMNLMKGQDDDKEFLRGLGKEFEQYMKRQSLLQYMINHPLGITIYGFLIDREFLRSFHMVVVSLMVFLVSLIMGGSHGK